MSTNFIFLRRLFTSLPLRTHSLAHTNNLKVSKYISTMPAAPSRTSSKRKIESESDQDESEREESSQNTKKPRKGKAPLPVPTQPTNKVMPVNIVIPPKHAGTVRIVAWNICGFAASSKKVALCLILAPAGR